MHRYLPTLLAALLLCTGATAVRAEKIELEGGDTIDAEIVEESESGIVVQHKDLGRIEIPTTSIKPPTPENPGLFGTAFLEGWTRKLSAGISGSTGNSQDTSINAALGLHRDAASFRGRFDTTYFFATTEGTRSTNQYTANYDHDFLFESSKFFLFGKARYDYDQFQAWLHRWSASTGLGYDFIKSKTIDFNGKIGAGFARTFDAEEDKRWRPEGVVGLVLVWRIVEGQTLEADVTYYPNLRSLPEFRLLANAAYSIGIGWVEGLSLKIGAKDDYDSEADGDNNNLKYYGNIAWDF